MNIFYFKNAIHRVWFCYWNRQHRNFLGLMTSWDATDWQSSPSFRDYANTFVRSGRVSVEHPWKIYLRSVTLYLRCFHVHAPPRLSADLLADHDILFVRGPTGGVSCEVEFNLQCLRALTDSMVHRAFCVFVRAFGLTDDFSKAATHGGVEAPFD